MRSQGRFQFAGAMSMTCLHAQIWNILGTRRRAIYTMSQSTRSKCCATRTFASWSLTRANCRCSQNQTLSPLLDVTLFLPRRMQTGLRGKQSSRCPTLLQCRHRCFQRITDRDLAFWCWVADNMAVGASGTLSQQAKAGTIPFATHSDGAVQDATFLDEVRQRHRRVCCIEGINRLLAPSQNGRVDSRLGSRRSRA